MIKVLQTFFDGGTHTLYLAGAEVADDPSIAYALKRGLAEKIEEKPAAEEEAKPKKTAAKKPTTKSTTKKK